MPERSGKQILARFLKINSQEIKNTEKLDMPGYYRSARVQPGLKNIRLVNPAGDLRGASLLFFSWIFWTENGRLRQPNVLSRPGRIPPNCISTSETRADGVTLSYFLFSLIEKTLSKLMVLRRGSVKSWIHCSWYGKLGLFLCAYQAQISGDI
jgi:hypothetical protein